MITRAWFAVIIVMIGLQVFGQEPGEHHHHDHHKHEIGLANIAVYFLGEEELAYGFHLHYTYNFHDSKFGIGPGYERIFDTHGHNTVGLVGHYRPVGDLVIGLSPGVTFEDGDPGVLRFALHLETSYEFEIGNLHLGPTLEFAYDTEDIHISLGIHIGLGFGGKNHH